MRLSACLFFVLMIATPVAAQDWYGLPGWDERQARQQTQRDQWSQAWDREIEASDLYAQPSQPDYPDWRDYAPEERAPTWEEHNRQEYNRQAPCALSFYYNDAAQEACWDSLGR